MIKNLGRNQKIAILFCGASFVSTYALTWLPWTAPYLSGDSWASFVSTFIPLSLGIILGSSAVVKGAQAISDSKKPLNIKIDDQ